MFRVVYRDDFFLRTVAVAERPLEPEEVERVDRVYHETMASSWPGTDRLVPVPGDGQARPPGRTGRADPPAGPARPGQPGPAAGPGLRPRPAGGLDQADAEFRRLLAAVDAGKLPESRARRSWPGPPAPPTPASRTWPASILGRSSTCGRTCPPTGTSTPPACSAAGGTRRRIAVLTSREPDPEGRVLLVSPTAGRATGGTPARGPDPRPGPAGRPGRPGPARRRV